MYTYIFAKQIQQAVTRSVQDELSKLEFKAMMQKRNVEQLENKMKLLELNLEKFKLEKMVHIYAYRITGKFGREKVWRIWRTIRDLPN